MNRIGKEKGWLFKASKLLWQRNLFDLNYSPREEQIEVFWTRIMLQTSLLVGIMQLEEKAGKFPRGERASCSDCVTWYLS